MAETGTRGGKVTVRLIRGGNRQDVLRTARFRLEDGRLRLKALEEYFDVKHIEWVEEEVVLCARDDGLTVDTFPDGHIVTITGDATTTTTIGTDTGRTNGNTPPLTPPVPPPPATRTPLLRQASQPLPRTKDPAPTVPVGAATLVTPARRTPEWDLKQAYRKFSFLQDAVTILSSSFSEVPERTGLREIYPQEDAYHVQYTLEALSHTIQSLSARFARFAVVEESRLGGTSICLNTVPPAAPSATVTCSRRKTSVLSQEDRLGRRKVVKGYLYKRGEHLHLWHTYWVVATRGSLSFFKLGKCGRHDKPATFVHLERGVIFDAERDTKRPFSFGIQRNEKTIYCSADTLKDRDEWVSSLRVLVQEAEQENASHTIISKAPKGMGNEGVIAAVSTSSKFIVKIILSAKRHYTLVQATGQTTLHELLNMVLEKRTDLARPSAGKTYAFCRADDLGIGMRLGFVSPLNMGSRLEDLGLHELRLVQAAIPKFLSHESPKASPKASPKTSNQSSARRRTGGTFMIKA